MMNARFWDRINEQPVKITLKPGQTLRHHTGGPDDEGWWSSDNTWSFDGATVTNDHVSDGRDCDGRLTSFHSSDCAVRDLKNGNEPYETDLDGDNFPKWRNVEDSQRDQFAEMAGY